MVGGASVVPDDWTRANHMMGGGRFIHFLVVCGSMAPLLQSIEVADRTPNPYKLVRLALGTILRGRHEYRIGKPQVVPEQGRIGPLRVAVQWS